MLFEIDDGLCEVAQSKHSPDLEGLQALLLAVRKGRHAVVASEAVFRGLAVNSDLGAPERATAKNLLNRLSELRNIGRHVTRRVRVYSSVDCSHLAADGDGWSLPASILSSRYVHTAVLLAENAVDADLFVASASHYRIFSGVKGVCVSLLPRGGGGSQIDVEFNASVRAGQSVLAVTDGDKWYPSQRPSKVSERCANIVAATEGIAWHICLDCYHAENLIPLSVYERACKDNDRFEEIKRIELINSKGGDPGDFFGWKDGLCFGQILKIEDQDARRFWFGVLEALDFSSEGIKGCLPSRRCGSNPCTCILSKGFGKEALKHVRDWMNEQSFHESFKLFRNSEKWLAVGRAAFDIGFAFPENRL